MAAVFMPSTYSDELYYYFRERSNVFVSCPRAPFYVDGIYYDIASQAPAPHNRRPMVELARDESFGQDIFICYPDDPLTEDEIDRWIAGGALPGIPQRLLLEDLSS